MRGGPAAGAIRGGQEKEGGSYYKHCGRIRQTFQAPRGMSILWVVTRPRVIGEE